MEAGELPTLGLYDCVVLELPGWCPTGNANGLGDLVGEAGSGDGEGVRARGDRGMWPTDLRRLGTLEGLAACRVFEQALVCSLCLRPCRVEGLW